MSRAAHGTPGDRHDVRADDARTVPEARGEWARLIWDYHRMRHALRPADVVIGLGSHDLGVARLSARLYHAGYAPFVLFTGGNSPTTSARFPRGEAVHYREHAVELGVPDSAILVEPHARNTGDNIRLSQRLLRESGMRPARVILVSKPYMERRSFATARKVWPEVEVICASEPLGFEDYVESVGDEKLVIDMLVGDLQRLIEYPKLGFAIEQEVPRSVRLAYESLRAAGYDSRLL